MVEYFDLAGTNQNDKLNAVLQDIHRLAGNFFFVLNTLKDGVKVDILLMKRQ